VWNSLINSGEKQMIYIINWTTVFQTVFRGNPGSRKRYQGFRETKSLASEGFYWTSQIRM